MSDFLCDICGALLQDSPEGYVTECEHYQLEKPLSASVIKRLAIQRKSDQSDRKE